jgi:BASS family bile acid:Na+ symporter
MEVINALLNIAVMVLIVSTMLAAGLGTTVAALGRRFRNLRLALLVLVMNLVLVPLIGWRTAEVLSLAVPASIALVLLACSPGAPIAAKLAMIRRGDVVTAAVSSRALWLGCSCWRVSGGDGLLQAVRSGFAPPGGST